MELRVMVEIVEKATAFLARAPELDFIAQGRTLEEAKQNLFHVIRIQFNEMKELGTLDDYLRECGFTMKGNQIVADHEMVGFERSTVLVG